MGGLRFGSGSRALNGPESRALRTSLHLERRHLTRLVNALQLLRGRRCNNDDIGSWEAGAGYPKGLLDLLIAIDAAVARLAGRLHAGRDDAGHCRIERPAVETIMELLALDKVGVVLDAAAQAAMMGDQGDVWQRLFDAVVVRTAELCDREGAKLSILRPVSPDGVSAQPP